MDQGILEAMKRRYKKCILRHLILENDMSSLTVPKILKQLTIKDAVDWCAQAWEEGTSDGLVKGWNKLLLSSEVGCSNVAVNGSSGGAVDGSADGQVGGSCGGMADDSSRRAEDTSADGCDAATGGSSSSIATSPRLLSDGDVGDVMEFRDVFQQLGYTPGDQNWQTPEDWLEEDSEDPGYQLITDNEILSEINGETTIDSLSEDDKLDLSSVLNSKACEAFNTALKWLEAQTDIDPVHLLLVKKWRDIALGNEERT